MHLQKFVTSHLFVAASTGAMLNMSVIKRKLISRVGPWRTMTSAVARSQPVDVNYVRNTLKRSNAPAFTYKHI